MWKSFLCLFSPASEGIMLSGCPSVRPSVRILTNIYSGSGRGWGVKANLIFVWQGGRRGGGGVKTNLNKKLGGPGKLLFFSVASSGLFFFGWGGRWVKRIYYFTFIILVVLQKASSDLIYFGGVGGGSGRSKGYFYLFWLSFNKYIGYIWFQLFLGGGRYDVDQRNLNFDCP